jgi:chromate reductase
VIAVPDASPVHVLGISGSLRRESLNTALLRAAIERSGPDVHIEEYAGLRDLPHYDADLDTERPPEAVEDLRRRISRADGLLIATPEYNYAVPGVLKNAIDWASRPVPGSSLEHKPIAIMGAAPGAFGSVRAQLSLRQSFLWTDSAVVSKPEVVVFRAAERFEDGRLVDEGTDELIRDLIRALVDLIGGRRNGLAEDEVAISPV